MTMRSDLTGTAWPLRWASHARGTWAADRNGRVIGGVRRRSGEYVATRGKRNVGTYGTLPEALDAVAHVPSSGARPVRVWTLLLAGINVAIGGSLLLLAAALLP